MILLSSLLSRMIFYHELLLPWRIFSSQFSGELLQFMLWLVFFNFCVFLKTSWRVLSSSFLNPGLGALDSLPCLLFLVCLRDTFIPEGRKLRDPRRLYAPGRMYHIVERKFCRYEHSRDFVSFNILHCKKISEGFELD